MSQSHDRGEMVVARPGGRERVKSVLAVGARPRPVLGATVLIYHRVGGGTSDELDVTAGQFERHVDILGRHDVVALDAALDRLDAGDESPSVVLTFDDGFGDVYENAWPVLREHGLPFLVYLCSAFVGTTMRWEGSTAQGAPGIGLTWDQLGEMVESGLCTVGNHTHTHARPEQITEEELDVCSEAIERHLGVRPRHFTYPWGVAVPALEPALRDRFRSCSTGELGRNAPDADRARLRRVPVRRTDPDRFFAAKLTGGLGRERAYGAVVAVAKSLGLG